MSGHANEPEFKGMKKHFNTFTQTGRFNIAFLTLSSIAGYFILRKLTKKKQ